MSLQTKHQKSALVLKEGGVGTGSFICLAGSCSVDKENLLKKYFHRGYPVAANGDKPCTNPLWIERLIHERPWARLTEMPRYYNRQILEKHWQSKLKLT